MSSKQSEWKAVHHKTYNRTFFYNKRTKKTSWYAPEEMLSRAQEPAEPPTSMTTSKSIETDSTHLIEANPKKKKDVSAQDTPQEQTVASSKDDDLIWEKHYHKHFKMYYYYNPRTRSSTWTDPETQATISLLETESDSVTDDSSPTQSSRAANIPEACDAAKEEEYTSEDLKSDEKLQETLRCQFPIGAKICIVGMEQQSILNDMTGTIVGISATARVLVQVAGKVLSVLPKALKVTHSNPFDDSPPRSTVATKRPPRAGIPSLSDLKSPGLKKTEPRPDNEGLKPRPNSMQISVDMLESVNLRKPSNQGSEAKKGLAHHSSAPNSILDALHKNLMFRTSQQRLAVNGSESEQDDESENEFDDSFV